MAPITATAATNPSMPAAMSKVLKKSVVHRPATLGKTRSRDEAGLDDEESDEEAAPPTAKRARFSEDTLAQIAKEEKVAKLQRAAANVDKEAAILEIRLAIKQHLEGNSELMNRLKGIFSGRGDESAEPTFISVETYIIALTNCVSMLEQKCDGLVKAVLDIDWIGRDEAFLRVFLRFVANLVSAQGLYLPLVLLKLADKLRGVQVSSGHLPDCPRLTRAQLNGRVHTALKYILRLVPSASTRLLTYLGSNFPTIEDSKKIYVTYINNLFTIIEYAPELKSEVFSLITDRLVKLDVHMQVDLDDLDDEVAEEVIAGLKAQNEVVNDPDESEVDSDSDDSDDEEPTRAAQIQDYVSKMDAILDILFSKYSQSFSDPNSLEAEKMFDHLLTHFGNIILPTYRSRHTQFLLFHFAQTAETHIEQFAGACVHLACNKDQPAILRQSAAAYLASFVARGAHVPAHTVRHIFDHLLCWVDAFREDHEVDCRGPDLRKYGTFYAMTQALLYIYCFRWRDLIVSPSEDLLEDDDLNTHDLEWLSGMKEKLTRTIYSKFNPLKICSPSVVEQFAKIAHHLRLIYVYPLLETNKRVRLSQFTGGAVGALRDTGFGNRDDSWHQLDAYFPFDPYQLPVSKRWVEGDYLVWKGVPGLDDDDEEEDSDDGEAEVDDEEEVGDDDDATTEGSHL